MSQTSLNQAADIDYLKGMASFGITNFTQVIMSDLSEGDRLLLGLPRKSLNALLQLPFSLMEQLLIAPHGSVDHLSFQTKLLHELIDFYLDINKIFKKKHQHELG